MKLGLLDDGQKIWEKIKITTDPAEAFTGVYFVQENGAENLEQKHEMVAVMEKYMPVDGIIASSSSGTPVTQIASEAQHPERIIVGHPFNPAYLLPLIEICGGREDLQGGHRAGAGVLQDVRQGSLRAEQGEERLHCQPADARPVA